ncbi:MAG: iron-containing alcohol dehydrogenase [Myxococcales bacterium]|nr:iron-containing alcohol dehydrogenase [Myxococcales bacterium]
MQDVIDRYCGFDRVGPDGRHYTTRTRLVRVERGVHKRVPDLLVGAVGDGKIALFCDATTRRVAGVDVEEALRRSGVPFEVHVLEPGPHDPNIVVCDDETIAVAEAILARGAYHHALAVGAGTVNDVTKMAAHRAGLDYSVVATAPSMNGYTSAIAAILSQGVKTTQPCAAPICAFADPDVMAAAPYRMIASGIGDLYSKPVSNADWRLAHRLLGQFHSDIVMEIVDAASAFLDGVAPRLPARDVEAVALLSGAIMLSGLAMQAAGSSGPASGGEHLVSHYIDMTATAFGLSHDFHGCQVAVGTLATSALYAELRAMDPCSIDVDACADAVPGWEDLAQQIANRFGPLADSVLPHARAGYQDREAVRARLRTLVASWDDIMSDVATTLRPVDELRDELRSAACPTTFAEIGVGRERAREALLWSKDIRARYTVLHLAAELGRLDDFVARYIDASFSATA